jgi:hypothetical protein
VAKSFVIGSIAFVLGFVAATILARDSSIELFHPSGRIVKADTELTQIHAPTPDRIAISTTGAPTFTTSDETWDTDFLRDVFRRAGCDGETPCSGRVSIPVRITYADPYEGLMAPLLVDASE